MIHRDPRLPRGGPFDKPTLGMALAEMAAELAGKVPLGTYHNLVQKGRRTP